MVKIKTTFMKKSLESQLAAAKKVQDAAEKKVKSLEAQIAKKAEASKPKKIWEAITTLAQVHKKLKVNPKKDVLKIQGFDKEDMKVVESLIAKMRICKVYNDGKLPAKNERWYAWFLRKTSGSGLVFNHSNFCDVYADTGSAARLSFIDSDRAEAYAKNFINVEEGITSL